MNKLVRFILIMMLVSTVAFAQNYKISGKVTSAESGEPLVGANVFIKALKTGAATDANGKYSFTVPAGNYFVTCSYIGYETAEEYVIVEDKDVSKVNFTLTDYEFSLSILVLADRAKERETPVAFTNLEKSEITGSLGSRDIPLVLNTTPSVYSTVGGGGAGDARINVRGFDQKNVAIMINGVPVNDMENGWVYWSNWDGVGDATSSIQVQRGLSAVNLATPSVGGTMNIITDPAKAQRGAFYKNEIGSGDFQKQSLFVNSGVINDKFAISFGGVKKTGRGVVEGTWTDSWAYYLGASYQLNKKNRLELYATGAPQRHGQNLYRNNAATYDHDFAKDELGYTQTMLDAIPEAGRLFNSNVSGVSSSYDGQQAWNDQQDVRHNRSFLNERENFYHKPIVNLNWYSQLSKNVSLYTTVYYSGGEGGGTGTLGKLSYDYTYMQRVVDWDATIANNIANADTTGGATKGIIRNSRNNQWTIGAISKTYIKLNKNLTVSAGIDWRKAEIEHYREVRDLLGGSFYIDNSSVFDVTAASQQKGLGDKVAYDYTNTVDWFGLYGQGEYTADKITLYGMAGYSMVKYTHLNHFKADPNDASKELELETDWINAFQVKGGASFRANKAVNVYANAGYVSKVPIFDQVISDVNAIVADDPQNETFLSFEAGAQFALLDNKLTGRVNGYYTMWKDRSYTQYVPNQNADDELLFLEGIDADHIGVEIEVGFQPVRFARIDAAVSLASWEHTDDAQGSYTSNGVTTEYTYTVKDLKVGDAPQTQFGAVLTLFPTTGFTAALSWKYNAQHYAAWEPSSREISTGGTADRAQVWETPSYHLFDLHLNYKLPSKIAGLDVAVFGHVFNLFDAVYVQDATDNSRYNGYKVNGSYYDSHGPSAAEIYLGLPTTFNVGFSVAY